MGEVSKKIGVRIRQLRKKRKISQEQLALRAGLNISFIGQIERGEKNPTIESVDKIIHALEVTFDDLFSVVKDERPNGISVDVPVDGQAFTPLHRAVFLLKPRSSSEQETICNLIESILQFKDKN